MFAVKRWAMPAALPILTFHAIDNRRSVISFPPELFARGMGGLHEGGYRSLGLPEAADRVRRRQAFPERAFAVTFDDGYESVYREAFPVLKKYRIAATVFLTVGESAPSGGRLPSLGERPMLSWSQILEMARSGIEFGAHTLTHPDLTRLPADKMEAEIARSKTVIEERLGGEAACFAYPFGRYDERSRALAARHFHCACSDRLGLATDRSDLFALERVDAYYLRSERLFALMLCGIFPWYIKARSVPRAVRRAFERNRG